MRKVDAPKEYAESLAQSCRSLLALLVQAKAKLVEEAQSNAPGVGQRVLFVVEDVFDVLSRSSVEVAEKLSEQHKLTAKDSLKAQSVVSEMKMATMRKANSVQAGNQAAEMEATFNRKLDERVQELLGAGGAELYKALKTIEGLKEELNEEKLKRQGDQGQLLMFKNMLQTEQARMVTLEEEAATEREAASAHVLEIRKCLALLDVPLDAEAEATGRLVRWPSVNVLAYHFPMIADEGRNQAFDLALTQAVARFKERHGGTPPRVLDIGSGSGLLAMMAARAGAMEVRGCSV
jgi:hypothetical protein